jgi:NitT/TauT family transport system substrate-binding protein
VYRVRIDDQLLAILKTHAAWRLASGNHPPGAAMPDFGKVLAPGPLRAIDPARVTVSGN